VHERKALIAGINAAKQTHMLIPLCHQLLLSKVSVVLTLDPGRGLHSFPFPLNLSLPFRPT
jgi:molybdenum cofactor biosynthesis enzyme